jgi:small subunit ribosomal protein S15
MRKAVKLGEHLKINNKDVHNTRSLRLTEAKILRLAKYYRSNNVIPDDWKYSLSNAKLLVG